MTCDRCGVELREDARLGLVGPDGRASCKKGGPHQGPTLSDRDLERLLQG